MSRIRAESKPRASTQTGNPFVMSGLALLCPLGLGPCLQWEREMTHSSKVSWWDLRARSENHKDMDGEMCAKGKTRQASKQTSKICSSCFAQLAERSHLEPGFRRTGCSERKVTT